MSNVDVQGESRGDIMRRLHRIERQIQELQAGRRLEAATVGRGGLRIAGGHILAEDADGEPVFRVDTDPPAIFMRQELIQQLTKSVFAEGIRVAIADEQVSTAADDWVELEGGPAITVDVSQLGIAIVNLSANIFGLADTTEVGVQGFMSVEVSGASTKDATTANQLGTRCRVLPSDQNSISSLLGATRAVIFDDLNAGQHTFTAVYKAALGFPQVNFNGRTMQVIAL